MRYFRLPFVKLTPILAVGILIANYWANLAIEVWIIILATTSLFLFLDYIKFIKIRYGVRWLSSILIASTVISLGALLLNYKQLQVEKKNSLLENDYLRAFEFTQLDIASKGKNSWALNGFVSAILNSNNQAKKVRIPIIAYLPDSLLNTAHLPGNKFLISAKALARIRPPQNPGEFDYAKFMLRKGITYTAYLKSNNHLHLKHKKYLSPYVLAQKMRLNLIAALKPMSQREKAVAMALVLGHKSELNEQTKMAYANSGALHVLAVSGLHVGIIFLLLNGILKLKRTTLQRTIKILILVAGLWFYAFVTGLPPSVVRAATMFTLIAIGTNINRPNNVYHNVMISAFAMLCYNPYYLFDVGFQLSYAAVIGIISWQPTVARWLHFNNKIANYAWQIVAVSLCAQLAVLPFSIYYFGQIPLLFPITNLVVIPAATFMLIGGFVVFVASFVGPTIHELALWPYELVIGWVNNAVFYIGNNDFSAIKNVLISPETAFLLAILIILLTICLIVKNGKVLVLASICFLAFCLNIGWQNVNTGCQSAMAVFSTSKTAAIGICDGKIGYLIHSADSASAISYQTLGFFAEHGISENKVLEISIDSLENLEMTGQFFAIKNGLIQYKKQLYGVNKKTEAPFKLTHIFTDYHLVSKLDSLPKDAILTSNIYSSQSLLKKPNFASAHKTRDMGAFVIEE
ncbi:MAG: ComEC/Rec2 family competence protein [Bacteroidetes bacterium]|nr:ComEC/Rec2 family competence protein [Bacteroidota bacterium]